MYSQSRWNIGVGIVSTTDSIHLKFAVCFDLDIDLNIKRFEGMCNIIFIGNLKESKSSEQNQLNRKCW